MACMGAPRALTLSPMASSLQRPRHLLPGRLYLRPRIRWARLREKDTHRHVPGKLLRPRRLRKRDLYLRR
jgi:hypothetical protein